MATSIHFTRDLAGKLTPWGAEDQEAIWLLKVGSKYRADIVIPRDNARLNWWWALAEIISSNDDRWPSKECASDMLKMRCGHFRTVLVPSAKHPGEFVTHYQAGSIKFHKMEETDFKALCQRAVLIASQCLACETKQLSEALDEFFMERSA